MKVVILAGGLGTRLSEETDVRPKPMVEIGGMPILWHIMKIYSSYGFNDFIICMGYKGHVIKNFFSNYHLFKSNLKIDLKNNLIEVVESEIEPWKITLVETGDNTMTGGRILRIKDYLEGQQFMLTYGDGLIDLDIAELVNYHNATNSLCTVTAVQPTGRFGALEISSEGTVDSFMEKPKGDGSWINGGFMVCEQGVFDYIENGDLTIWEEEPLRNLAKDRNLSAFKHSGFWRPMDTLKDKNELNELWNKNNCPWKKWI